MSLAAVPREGRGRRRAPAGRWSLFLLMLGSILTGTGGAQAPAVLLEQVRMDFEACLLRRDLANMREGDATLRRLEALVDASSEVRGRACGFLRGVLLMPEGGDVLLRWRATAVRLLGLLGDEVEQIDLLLKVAVPDEVPALAGLELFAERALGEVRSKAQVERLLLAATTADHRRRRLALGGLASLVHAEHLPLVEARLADLLALGEGSDPEILSRAVLLLGRLQSAKVLPALLRASQSREALVRLSAARSLAHWLQVPGVSSILARLLEDPVARIREEAALAFRQSKDPCVAPVLVHRLRREPLRVRVALADTLQSLTGLDLGPEAEPWEEWRRGSAAAESGERAGASFPRPRYAARYYGIPILSDRLVFVLDVSGSMGFSSGGPSRLARAQSELAGVLARLDPRTEFNLVTFSSGVRRWSRSVLVRASDSALTSALAFVRRQKAEGATNTITALEEVFLHFPTVDTIYFLSDGAPTAGRTAVTERILSEVHHWNRVRGVRIHAVALLVGVAPSAALRQQDDQEEAARFMKALATENGGQYIRISS